MVINKVDLLFEMADEPDYEPSLNDSIAARASRDGITPEELALDVILSNDGRGMLYFPFLNYVDGNLDGVVDGLDYLLWAAAFGEYPPADPPGSPGNGDFDNNGFVDGIDYIVWAENFGAGSAAAVPEPSGIGLALFACVGFVLKRKKARK